jgi:hypothetical protein
LDQFSVLNHGTDEVNSTRLIEISNIRKSGRERMKKAGHTHREVERERGREGGTVSGEREPESE